MISTDGHQYYLQKGQYHREDGPAIIYSYQGAKPMFYLNGKNLTEQIFQELNKGRQLIKALSSLEKFSDKYGGAKEAEKAGIAVMKFLRGECDHQFKTKTSDCELCISK